MRYAIYFTPPPDDPLTRTASAWLGRDAFTGAHVAPKGTGGLSAAECAYHTASARRYGFHATLKAPFRLADGESEASLFRAFDGFVAAMRPVTIPRLGLRRIDGFFALVPEEPVPDLDRLAGETVAAFDRFRAPLTEAEVERRVPDALPARELAYLHRWGYPYVFDAFRFHMTVSGRVGAADVPRVGEALRETFSAHLGRPLAVASLALFVEPEDGAPFSVGRFAPLGMDEERIIA